MIYFTKEQRNFRDDIRAFAKKELSDGAWERGKLAYTTAEVLKKLAGNGLFKMTTPVSYGGTPLDCVSIGIAFQEVCAIDYSPFSLMLSHVVIPLMMTEWATREAKDEWLPLLARAEKLACFGNTEPDCGSDAAAIKTRARREGASYVISGEKTSISGGMQADCILMTARTDPEAGIRGISCFFVPFSAPGISKSPFNDMGAIPSGRASISFDDVCVPLAARVGAEGEGFTRVMNTFDFARVLVILAGIGMAEQTLTETVEYVKKRQAFGGPISKFEGVSFKLAEAVTVIEATRLLCYKALKLRDEGLPHTKEVAMAKWYGGTHISHAIHDMLLIHGWKGYSERLPIEQRLRDSIGLKIGDGTGEIMKLIIARELLGNKFRPTL
jgi:cyclohexanecarboxyl-CoA dehydrogenase